MKKVMLGAALIASAALWWQFGFAVMACIWFTGIALYTLWNA